MKRAICILAVIGLCSNLYGQNKSSYFKTIPTELSTAPDWALMMYSADPNVAEVEYLYETWFREHSFVKDIHTQNYKHWMMMVQDLVDGEGKIRDLGIWGLRDLGTEGLKSGFEWTLAGPVQTYNFPEQGGFGVSWQANVYCFDQCVSNPMICYAGIEGGGLYKSSNKGVSWSMVSEDVSMSTVDDVKVAPSMENRVLFTSGGKIFKSEDGGYHWELNYEIGERGLQLLIHPDNPDIVFCAAENGLFRTNNAGDTWTKIVNNTCWDIAFHPRNPQIIYLLQHSSTEKRSLFLKSTDGGLNFSKRDDGWYVPQDLATANDIGGKIGVTPADPDRVYVALIGESKADDNGWIGIYRSRDAGESWVNPNPPAGGPFNANTHPNLASSNPNGTGFHQGFFNFALAVSHQNPDLLWVGTLSLNKSEDGGASWTRIGSYNAQQDIGWIHPDIQDLHVLGSDVWVCSDGGINYSTDQLRTHESRNLGLAGSNLWGFGQGWNEDVMVGGRYHNGNFGYYEAYPFGFSLRLGGAEASTGYVNPQFNRQVYFSDINTNILPESMSGPQTLLPPMSVYPNEAYTESHSSEMEWDPRYSDHVYVGNGGGLFKSKNGGGYFEQLYNFGTTARVLEIEVSRSNPEVIYVVSQPGGGYWDNCFIYRSADGGHSFSRTTSVPTTSRWRTEITLNPEDENELWVMSITGSNGRKVYRTLDGGESWENMTSGLLDDHRPQDILFQAGTDGCVYLVTIAGAFYFDPETAAWVDYSNGLPLHTRALEMKPFYAAGKLRLATGGHAVWENKLVTRSRVLAQPMTETDTLYRKDVTVNFDSYSVVELEGASFEWAFDPEPQWVSDHQARNPQVIFGQDGSYSVSLKVTDQYGVSDTKTVRDMVTVMDISGVQGEPGLTLQANAAGDYMVTEDFKITTEVLTIAAWIKPEGIQPDYSGIAISSGETAGMNFRGGNNTLGYHWPGGSWSWNSGLVVQPYKWSHVALVADGDRITLYVDGIGVTHQTDISPVLLTVFNIGSYKGWASRNFTGQIDEVSFWKRALTQEEIRLMMHLTLENKLGDEDLMAYYQFNEPTGPVLDKKGNLPGELYGTSRRTVSSAPVGSGVSGSAVPDFGGDYQFGETGVTISVPFYGVKPDGEVVVTRLDLNPNILPNENPNAETHWIIDNYGKRSFEALAGLKLTVHQNPTPELLAQPSLARLYKRRPDTDLQAWEPLCTAKSAQGDSTILLSFDASCQIRDFGQYVLVSDKPDVALIRSQGTGIGQFWTQEPGFMVYPNPVLSGEHLLFYSESIQDCRISLYGADGKLVRDVLDTGQNQVEISTIGLKPGWYFYRIKGARFLQNGVVIIR